jgi:aspartyl-tRNA(Asn)/glutamyl-tRNA(Gln) amidotransferase subunit C
MTVTLEDVRHVAALARLGVSDERARALVNDLNTILEHMDALDRVKTTGVAEAVAVGAAGMRLRKDGGPPIALDAAPDACAPEMRDGFFLVPRLSTHEDAES